MVPFLAVQARRARAEDVRARAVVAAPVVAEAVSSRVKVRCSSSSSPGAVISSIQASGKGSPASAAAKACLARRASSAA
ncbi:hypothetical protein QRN89_35485 (plasmid) [Streptomyces chengbuensis]|uniref:hypothetical protein n=1 Tax=Streptomyces chengbuensis TaxID=3053466 RepID=UPI0025B61074|nr:hypothetical protein [Streptomyces sp. HUAS CB01]WJY55099.1 hypothetical protein QRN89_35485 [Streptomyces sp. HUAS CB01]